MNHISYFLQGNLLDSMNKTIEGMVKEIFKPENSPEESPPVSQQTSNSKVVGLKKREALKSNKRPEVWTESMQEKAKKKDMKTGQVNAREIQ